MLLRVLLPPPSPDMVKHMTEPVKGHPHGIRIWVHDACLRDTPRCTQLVKGIPKMLCNCFDCTCHVRIQFLDRLKVLTYNSLVQDDRKLFPIKMNHAKQVFLNLGSMAILGKPFGNSKFSLNRLSFGMGSS